GLLCSKSKGQLKPVWLATEGTSCGAALHVAWRHGARIEAVITVEVDVPRSWLRRSRKGLWYCTRDIPPDRIRRLFGFVELARVAGGVQRHGTKAPLFRCDSSQKGENHIRETTPD